MKILYHNNCYGGGGHAAASGFVELDHVAAGLRSYEEGRQLDGY